MNKEEIEFLFNYIIQFGQILYDQESKVILLDTPILNFREDKYYKNTLYKIRLKTDATKYT